MMIRWTYTTDIFPIWLYSKIMTRAGNRWLLAGAGAWLEDGQWAIELDWIPYKADLVIGCVDLPHRRKSFHLYPQFGVAMLWYLAFLWLFCKVEKIQ